jgi:hypothetical protein
VENHDANLRGLMVAQHLLDAILMMSRDDGKNRQRSQNCQHRLSRPPSYLGNVAVKQQHGALVFSSRQGASWEGDGQAKASEYLESSAAVVDLINNQNPLALEAIAHTRDGIEPLKLCRPLPACVCLVVVELQAHGDDGDLDKGAEHAGGNEASAADGDHEICGMVGRR